MAVNANYHHDTGILGSLQIPFNSTLTYHARILVDELFATPAGEYGRWKGMHRARVDGSEKEVSQRCFAEVNRLAEVADYAAVVRTHRQGCQ